MKLRLAALVAAALGMAGAVAVPGVASAVEGDVSGVVFDWGINNESNGGAYFGGCNFLSAGVAGDTGSARLWTEADGFYRSADGNTTIVKPSADGSSLVSPTWATKCQTPSGTSVNSNTNGSNTASYTQSRVQISEGSGSVDVDANTADISWDGSFTVAYYGGMTYWSASDPHLVVNADGTGTVTATLSGYGTDMDDMSIWQPIAGQTVTLANLTGVEVTDTGFEVTPDYLGVTIPEDINGRNPQDMSGSWAGAFPGDFLEFQQLTGQNSYWYSTAGTATSIQPRKATLPLTITYELTEAPVAEPTLTVTPSADLDPEGDTITISGSGYDASATSSWSSAPAGFYVQVGWIDEDWRPSEGAGSSTRSTAYTAWVQSEDKALPYLQWTLDDDGFASFEWEVEIDQATLDAKSREGASLAVFSVGAGGSVQAVNELATTISFAEAVEPEPTETVVPEPTETVVPEPTETVVPEPTETAVPEPTETVAPEPTETAVPEPTETVAPEPTETVAPEPTETAVPEPTETVVPEPTETVAPEPTETAVPEPTETVAPEPTETVAPEPTETVAPEPTETVVPEPTETTAPGAPSFTPDAPAADGDSLPTDQQGAVEITKDGDDLTVSGLTPNAWYYLYVYSEPQGLGWFQADGSGQVGVTLPDGLATGEHRIAVLDATGALVGWNAFTLEADASATPTASTPTTGLTPTGDDAPAIWTVGTLALLLGAAGVLVVARRREAARR